MTTNYDRLLQQAEDIIAKDTSREKRLAEISRLLAKQVPYFDWVGFYLVEETEEDQLVLGPYVGDPTEHTRIAFGQGICGQAADIKATFVVQDVSQEENYLSCSPDVKSEIVVPIFKHGDIVGELDIDSHTRYVFTDEDRTRLEELCQKLSALF